MLPSRLIRSACILPKTRLITLGVSPRIYGKYATVLPITTSQVQHTLTQTRSVSFFKNAFSTTSDTDDYLFNSDNVGQWIICASITIGAAYGGVSNVRSKTDLVDLFDYTKAFLGGAIYGSFQGVFIGIGFCILAAIFWHSAYYAVEYPYKLWVRFRQ